MAMEKMAVGDGQPEGIPVAHSRRPSLVGSEGNSPTPQSCGFGKQQAALGKISNQTWVVVMVYGMSLVRTRIHRGGGSLLFLEAGG